MSNPESQTTGVVLDMSDGELRMLRDVVIRAHGQTGGNWVQTPSERMGRVHALLEAAIEASPVMRGILGRGGPESHRDILGGTGDLS